LTLIDFSYTTSYRLSIVTFVLGHNTFRADDDRRTQHSSISTTVYKVRSAKNVSKICHHSNYYRHTLSRIACQIVTRILMFTHGAIK